MEARGSEKMRYILRIYVDFKVHDTCAGDILFYFIISEKMNDLRDTLVGGVEGYVSKCNLSLSRRKKNNN